MNALDAAVTVGQGEFLLDMSLHVDAGEVVALLGPNGSGKSTLLGALAGLRRLRKGRIQLGGTVLDDTATGRHMQPRDRRVGLVVQDYLLFPHLDVTENIAFGLRARGVARATARARAGEWLEQMGLAGHGRRKPTELSGGQAQRVALARALIVDPALLLLDEPLAALDAGTRPAVRAGLRRHLTGYAGCAIVVTHDPLEAMVLGDRIVVLERGRVVQEGTPAAVARHPRTEYVARLVGLNLLRGHADGKSAELSAGAAVALPHDQHGPVHVAFAPSAVTLSPDRPGGSARNVWPGTIQDMEAHGDVVRISVEGAVPLLADVTPLAVAELGLEPGASIWASVKATEVNAYPR
ncbi:ABC transporter ATP-binding protein [Phytoactinopolyspora mesophila]|uniref:ATP-binding cassette domain-containing protein n=1 Tax=Phytoactinopolyspora mesophila TaxID=2650750 RepID=A0A7K3M917_9ACTN|nr:ABC transporter ATP-binding protein [Phytoactinopolyspora mesophila]NDL59805.1 ATP-binding cassette domain-containing protein [Phytoactinopolyspora mesophila]